jgi:hypothetical protein
MKSHEITPDYSMDSGILSAIFAVYIQDGEFRFCNKYSSSIERAAILTLVREYLAKEQVLS